MDFNLLTTCPDHLRQRASLPPRATSGRPAGSERPGGHRDRPGRACGWTLDGASLSEPFKKLLQLSFWVWFATTSPRWPSSSPTRSSRSPSPPAASPATTACSSTPPESPGWPSTRRSRSCSRCTTPASRTSATSFSWASATWCSSPASSSSPARSALAVIEYYLVVTLATCLIPFGISQHTRFLAEKAIGAVVAVSVKLMVLSFIIALIQPVIVWHPLLSGTRRDSPQRGPRDVPRLRPSRHRRVAGARLGKRPPGGLSIAQCRPGRPAHHQLRQQRRGRYAGAAGIASKGLEATKAAAGGAKTAAVRAGGGIQKVAGALRGASALPGLRPPRLPPGRRRHHLHRRKTAPSAVFGTRFGARCREGL